MKSADPVICHKCKTRMAEGEGYYFSLSRLHWTAQDLPIYGHLYCEACIERVHEMAFTRGLRAFLRRLTSGPGAVQTAADVPMQMTRNGWSKDQWKKHCRDQVAWWWQRHGLVAQGRVPPWEITESDVDKVIGKYRDQSRAWRQSGEICEAAYSIPQQEIISRVDDIIRAYPDFEPYARFWRGVYLDRSGNPSAAIQDFNQALDLDPRLHWAYYYRAVCFYKTDNVEQATRDKDLALSLMPNLKRGFAGPW